MKRELWLWEFIMTAITVIGFFIAFSLLDGLDLAGTEKYRVAIIAMIAGGIFSCIFVAGGMCGLIAGVVITVVSLIIGWLAGAAVAAIVAAAVTGILTTFVAVVIADQEKFRNFFTIFSLAAEVLITFGIMSAVTFYL